MAPSHHRRGAKIAACRDPAPASAIGCVDAAAVARRQNVARTHPDLSRAYWEDPGDHTPPGGESWNTAAARVTAEGLEPEPKSGRQERLENLWNRYV